MKRSQLVIKLEADNSLSTIVTGSVIEFSQPLINFRLAQSPAGCDLFVNCRRPTLTQVYSELKSFGDSFYNGKYIIKSEIEPE